MNREDQFPYDVELAATPTTVHYTAIAHGLEQVRASVAEGVSPEAQKAIETLADMVEFLADRILQQALR